MGRGDGNVDGQDITDLIVNFTGDPGPLRASTAVSLRNLAGTRPVSSPSGFTTPANTSSMPELALVEAAWLREFDPVHSKQQGSVGGNQTAVAVDVLLATYWED